MKIIYNGKIILEDKILENKAIVFDSKIKEIIDEDQVKNYDCEKIDAEGNFVSPGLIDIHIHGCKGSDTSDDNDTAIDVMSREVIKTGVTSFLPTSLTLSRECIRKVLKRVRTRMEHSEGANVLGCHLEGPFINVKHKGAQDERYIIPPDFSMIEDYKDVVKIISMAPELSGSLEFIDKCVENGIVVSIGHTDATYDEAVTAIKRGASHITHTYNAMTPLHHRNPGVVGAAMLEDGVSCELIVDNIHIHPAAQRILLKMKGIDNITLITDAMRACMMPNGEYLLGELNVFVKDGKAVLKDGTLAGSILRLNVAVRNFMKNTGLPIYDVVRAASLNQAKLLKVDDRKGSIEVGKDADITIFDNDINIKYTFVNGNEVYRG